MAFNPVAKHNQNRAATHPDRSKEPQSSVEEGLLEYLAKTSENDVQEEYRRAMMGNFTYVDEIPTTDTQIAEQFRLAKQRPPR